MIGYVTVIIQVQQRRKDALLLIGDEGAAASESSLQQLVSRYRLDLWPCSSQDLDYLARQQVCIIARLLGMNNNNNNNIYILE